MEVPRGEYIAHHKWATPDMFDPHTDESIVEMVRILDGVNETGTRAELAHLSQVFGITFNKATLLWDEELRHVARPITGTYWDWMHILLASGCVFQYEANQFILEARRSGIALEDFDALAANIRWRKEQRKLALPLFPTSCTHR